MAEHQIWQMWRDNLHGWGIEGVTAVFLNVLGPLTWLGAQAVYLGQPLLRILIPETHLSALIAVLEDDHCKETFIALLQEDRTA